MASLVLCADRPLRRHSFTTEPTVSAGATAGHVHIMVVSPNGWNEAIKRGVRFPHSPLPPRNYSSALQGGIIGEGTASPSWKVPQEILFSSTPI